MKMQLRRSLSLCGIFLLPLVLITCKKDQDEQPTGPSELLFVNGLTDGNISTILLSDSTYLPLTAGFGNFTQYVRVNSGSQNVKLKDNSLDGIIVNTNLNITGTKNYTLMAVGTESNAELILKEDDLNIADTTQAYIRLINLSANSLPMTLYITSGTDLASNIAYKSVSDFIPVQPAKYNLSIKAGSTVISSTMNTNLLAKKKYSILITGLVNQIPKASYNIIVNK